MVTEPSNVMEPQVGSGQSPDECTRKTPRTMTVVALAGGFTPAVCMSPPRMEVLDQMADSTPDDITPGELYRAISGMRDDLDKGIGSLRTEMREAVDGLRREFRTEIGGVKDQLARVVYVDVFTAEQRVISEREGALRVELKAATSKAESAQRMSWTCLFLIVSSILGAIVIAVVAAIR